MEQTIPSLPNANAMVVNEQLMTIRKTIHALHWYCSAEGPVEWGHQMDAGKHIFNELANISEAVVAVIAKNKSTWI